MEITIYVNRKKFDKDYLAATDEYIKRTSPYCRMQLKPFSNQNKSISEKTDKTAIYAVVPDKETCSSTELATQIQKLNLHGISAIEYFICCDESDYERLTAIYKAVHNTNMPRLCLSSFSLDEELTAVVLTEQIYRAYTILNNITYHK